VFVVSRIVNCIVYSSCKVIYSLGECMYHMMRSCTHEFKKTNKREQTLKKKPLMYDL
jgi:hypothetical protein